MPNELLLYRTTSLSIAAATARLQEVSAAHRFGVQAYHNLREKMAAKGVAFDREVRIVEVCNPAHAATVLRHDIEVSTALPCRISLYEEDGRTVLATIKPTAMLGMFRAAGAAATAQEVEDTLVRIMDETCHG
ncbi:MAG: hypothetical protein C0502_06455 [Opitutus sp.]|nr:hypothetical protein [Opitutus sp.]